MARGSRCDQHQVAAAAVKPRQGSTARGYGYKWQKARDAFLQENPLCDDCLAAGKVERATVVDHHIPHKGDPGLFWDRANWRPKCKRHHDAKTARQDGGFGNRGRG